MKRDLMMIMCILIAGAATVFGEGTREPETASADQDGTSVLIDEAGREIEVPGGVRRIACLVPQAGEILAILGKDDLVIARSDDVVFPESYLDIPNVGSTNDENIELLLETSPDLVIGRATLLDDDSLTKIAEALEVPIILYRGTNLDTSLKMARDFADLLGAHERAEEFIHFVSPYIEMLDNRIASIPESEKASVFFQSMGHMFWSGNRQSSGHLRIVEAGGINIAADEDAKVPRLSAEWVLERDPQIIIHSYSGARKEQRAPSSREMHEKYEEIVTTPGLKEVRAVRDGKVHVVDVRLITGPQSLIGKLYYAKWISPESFSDVDPGNVHRLLMEEFFGVSYDGVWVYP